MVNISPSTNRALLKIEGGKYNDKIKSIIRTKTQVEENGVTVEKEEKKTYELYRAHAFDPSEFKMLGRITKMSKFFSTEEWEYAMLKGEEEITYKDIERHLLAYDEIKEGDMVYMDAFELRYDTVAPYTYSISIGSILARWDMKESCPLVPCFGGILVAPVFDERAIMNSDGIMTETSESGILMGAEAKPIELLGKVIAISPWRKNVSSEHIEVGDFVTYTTAGNPSTIKLENHHRQEMVKRKLLPKGAHSQHVFLLRPWEIAGTIKETEAEMRQLL